MAANYWESTQRRFWQFTKDELSLMRDNLEEDEQSLVQMFPLPQWRHLSIYFNQRKRPASRLNLHRAPRAQEVISLTITPHRAPSLGKEAELPTAGRRNCAVIHQALLLQSRNPSNEPLPRAHDRLILSL